MLKKIALAVGGLLVLLLIFIGTREGKFDYHVSEYINAPVEKVFPYLSDLQLGGDWSPFERVDINMKKDFEGPTNEPGGKMIFSGNSEAGAGTVEILKVVPNQLVELKLIMTAPFPAENLIRYTVVTENDGTRMTWSMSGDGGFLGKVMNLFIDCEKMITDQFKQGIANLKAIVEPRTAQ